MKGEEEERMERERELREGRREKGVEREIERALREGGRGVEGSAV